MGNVPYLQGAYVGERDKGGEKKIKDRRWFVLQSS